MQIDQYKKSRLLYIFQALIEYAVSIVVASSYLATLTSEIGISDGLTGIISAIISLGCIFELFSFFIRPKKIKPIVTIFSIINQLLFLFLYVIPFIDISQRFKTIIFICDILMAYIVYYVIHPLKISWFMSLIDNKSRGVFTANKEIVSLIGGTIFSYIMGAVVDYYKGNGNIRMAFIIIAVVIFTLIVLHSLTMIFSIEKEGIIESKTSFSFSDIKNIFNDKKIQRVAVIFSLWSFAMYSTIPFYGTYQIKELGFSLKYVAFLLIVYAVFRISVSRLLGRYADKNSFSKMMRLCLIIAGAGFFINIFTNPSNGKILFTIYTALNGIANGGLNSAQINMIYDNVDTSKRTEALAVVQSASGIVGFFSTLMVSLLVSYIQKSGFYINGKLIYAQQVTSFIAVIFTLLTILFLSCKNVKKKDITI